MQESNNTKNIVFMVTSVVTIIIDVCLATPVMAAVALLGTISVLGDAADLFCIVAGFALLYIGSIFSAVLAFVINTVSLIRRRIKKRNGDDISKLPLVPIIFGYINLGLSLVLYLVLYLYMAHAFIM